MNSHKEFWDEFLEKDARTISVIFKDSVRSKSLVLEPILHQMRKIKDAHPLKVLIFATLGIGDKTMDRWCQYAVQNYYQNKGKIDIDIHHIDLRADLRELSSAYDVVIVDIASEVRIETIDRVVNQIDCSKVIYITKSVNIDLHQMLLDKYNYVDSIYYPDNWRNINE